MIIDIDIDTFTYPDVPLPQVWTVEQKFATPALTGTEIDAQTREAVRTLVRAKDLARGSTVAVGVGSRGLDNLVATVRSAISELRALGMQPFIVPAMGSHGGATPEGQTEVLHGYGITPEAVGAEIRATMDVEQVGTLNGEDAGDFAGQPIYWEKNALSADAVLLINRIKAHTDFSGPIESGLAKILAIGLGKRSGTEAIHALGQLGWLIGYPWRPA